MSWCKLTYLPEGRDLIEIVIQAHGNQRSWRETELEDTERETDAGAKRSRHTLHLITKWNLKLKRYMKFILNVYFIYVKEKKI